MINTNVEEPHRRFELIQNIRALSDAKYQKIVWVEHKEYDGIIYDNFEEVIRFLYEDTDLADDPRSCIGYILKNEEEANFLSKICTKLEHIVEIYGRGLPDSNYINAPEWPELMKQSQEFLEVLKRNGP